MRAALLWARSDIRRGLVSLLGVALLVAIAGGGVMAGVAGARRTAAAVDRYLADTGLPEVTVYTQNPLDDRIRAAIDADPRVDATTELIVMLATPTSKRPGLDGASIVVPDAYWGELAHPRLVDGRYPSGPDEVAITETAAKDGRFGVGDVVDFHMLTNSEALACFYSGDCTPRPAGPVTIVGLLRMPADLAPGPFGESVFAAPEAFLEARGGEAAAWGRIVDVYLVEGADVDAFVGEYSVQVTDGDVTNANTDDVAGALRATDLQHDALLIGTAIAAVAGMLIVGQAFGRYIARRSNDAAALQAVGMTTWQRTLTGWLPGLLGAMVGTVLAIPVAIALSPLFPLGLARRADPDVGFHVDLSVMIIGAAAIFIVSAISALLSAALWGRAASAGESATAISPIAQLAEGLHLWPVPMMGLRFALEPGRGRRRVPVLPALAGTATAVGVVVGALLLASSLDGLLATADRYGAPWDLQVTVGEDFESAANQIAADSRVDGSSIAVSGELDITADGEVPIQAFAIGLKSVTGSIEPVVLEGRAPIGSDEIMVGSDTMERLRITIGDEVGIGGPTGNQQVVVVGRAIVPIVSTSSTDEGMVVPLDTFLRLGGTETVSDIDVEAVVLVTTDPSNVEAVGNTIEAAGGSLSGPFRQASVTVLDDVREVPIYVAVFTMFIGALAAFHALVVTGRRRRKDLAVMRALGCRPRQAAGVIHWQGFFLAAAALMIGVPLGLIGGRLLWNSIAIRANVLSVIETPWAAISVIAVATIIGTAVVLALGPSWAARRHRPGTELRAE